MMILLLITQKSVLTLFTLFSAAELHDTLFTSRSFSHGRSHTSTWQIWLF